MKVANDLMNSLGLSRGRSLLFLSLADKYGKTVIMASHDPKAVEHFQKVYNMRDGNFV
jgi:ABC-type lipoprotein export system ATPase subunit